MTTRTALLLSAAMTAAAFVYTLILYPTLPPTIPVHWDIHGEIDGWADKSQALYLLPGTMALFTGMILALPWLSPRNFSVDSFRETFNTLMAACVGFFGYLHVVMLQAALHPDLRVGRVLMVGLFLFIALMGNMMGKVRRNFWVGVRTPWTLASDRVWIATHRLAARLMVAAGLFGAVGVGLGAPIFVVLTVLMAALIYPIVHSLVLYKKLDGEGTL